MNTHKFRGLGVAIVTPFKEDKKIDYLALQTVVNNVIVGGVDYLVVHGSTGEAITLSDQEKRHSLDFILEVNNGRVPIVIGFGTSDTMGTINAVSKFDMRGVDGLLISSPSYCKPNQEGIYKHFEMIANATDLPIILYNVPSRTASNMTSETTLNLAKDFENIVAIKEASGDMLQIIEIIQNRPNGFAVISGDDEIIIPLVASGGDGVISVMANAFPESMKEITYSALKGELKVSREIQNGLKEMTVFAFEQGNPAGIKEILNQNGVCKPFLRLPLTRVSEELRLKIKNEISSFDRIKSN